MDKHIAKFENNVTDSMILSEFSWMLSRHDIMVNLLKGYNAVTDGQFKKYISQKINEYDSGGHVKEERLMILSQNKNKMLVRSGE